MHKQHVVIRFCGDSGDGMQLTGTMFSSLSAILGNEISTLPDFPAEIRAPQGTLGGVSGFQVQLGAGVYTPGDKADVLVAMNAAALKVGALGSKFNVPGAQWNEADSQFKRDAVIIIDTDSLVLSDLVLIKLKTKKEYRSIPKPLLQDNKCIHVDLSTFSISAYRKDDFLIQPITPLEPGEYIFTFTTLSPVGDFSDWIVWPFSIAPQNAD